MSVLYAGPRGTISQHPACCRLQQGDGAGEGIQGWKVIACRSHKSKEEGWRLSPFGSRVDVHVDTAGRVEWMAL